MKLTTHGFERIYSRTRMHHDDVLSIVENQAAVDLGSAYGQRYFLFHSPPDRRTKIALVSGDLKVLISIWEDDYRCPDGIRKVTPELKMEALIAFRRFRFSRIKAPEPEKPVAKPSLLRATVVVYSGQNPIYECDGGEIPPEDVLTRDSLAAVLMPKLIPIVTLVELHKRRSDGRIQYCIRLSDANTSRFVGCQVFRHGKILERMPRPPE